MKKFHVRLLLIHSRWIQRGQSRDGQPGANALGATPGARAGFLAVNLSESSTTEEGITVHTLGFTSRQEPPQWLEVPARKNLIVSAVGGRGESGHRGGNGQAGMDGIDGFPATREVDATVISLRICSQEKKLTPHSPEQTAVTVASKQSHSPFNFPGQERDIAFIAAPDEALMVQTEVMGVLLKFASMKTTPISFLLPNGTSRVGRVARLVITVNPGMRAEVEMEEQATNGETTHLVDPFCPRIPRKAEQDIGENSSGIDIAVLRIV